MDTTGMLPLLTFRRIVVRYLACEAYHAEASLFLPFSLMQPTVIINQHRQTALVVATSGKKLLVIKLTTGKLVVTTVSLEEIKQQGYNVSDYSPKMAALSYLQHGGGVSARAKKCLEKIANSEFSANLELI